jgi:diguanylate cyclase (GGDEF)-like protein
MIYAERLRRHIEKHPFKGEESQPLGDVTISIGIATFPEDGTDGDTLIEHADQALYEAKESGRNRVIAYAGGCPA